MKFSKALSVFAFCAAFISCTKIRTEIIENIITVPSYPDLEDIKADTVRFTSAEASFYGAYSQTIDRWYITLSTCKDLAYDLATDSYSGNGMMLKLCLHTPISNATASELDVITRKYTCPDSYSDLIVGNFETGYSILFQNPYLGKLPSWHGTYYAMLISGTEYSPVMCMDGLFEVKHSAGKWTVSGTLLDEKFRKIHFIYEGDMILGPEYQFPGMPDSSISADVQLDKTILPKIEIRDRGDQYRYDSKPRFRNYRVYLTGSDVNVSVPVNYIEDIKLSGSGPVMLLDLFVNPDADGRIPAGDYELIPRLENAGIDGSLIWPYKFLEGYPHFYFGGALQGCWYFNLGSDGLWKGDYARVTRGTVKVSYKDGSNSPIIDAVLYDCSTPAHKITLNWK